MRYMGIDFGTKRVGIALTDEAGSMAFPSTTLSNDRDLLASVLALVADYAVGAIVIGRSENLAGEANALQEHIDVFADALREKTGLSVHEEPEQFTTQEALHIQGRTDQTDASAAALILNSFLMKHNDIT